MRNQRYLNQNIANREFISDSDIYKKVKGFKIYLSLFVPIDFYSQRSFYCNALKNEN